MLPVSTSKQSIPKELNFLSPSPGTTLIFTSLGQKLTPHPHCHKSIITPIYSPKDPFYISKKIFVFSLVPFFPPLLRSHLSSHKYPSALPHSLLIFKLQILTPSLSPTFFYELPNTYVNKIYIFFADLSFISLICRPPSTEPKRVEKKVFFPLPKLDLAQGTVVQPCIE